ncbi:oxidoreductase [Kwoniella heveanensis BCC8398]|uniref:Oxidoreductase n=1 Tax=Kwoniella heveanensis BCC8398 TaxID=1296120 RepID=A0A1B9GZG8_9TREE|nr:oxidoreductase [Kwoniella heveanensis BCC8398]
MSLGRTLKLNNGVTLPQVGFGTWQAAPGEVEKAVEEAIKVGYRHIDCALIVLCCSLPPQLATPTENQDEVAQGIKASGVAREDLFLISKLWCNSASPANVEADLDTTLSQLGTDYLDVYLIHWPVTFKAGKDLFPKSADGKTVILDDEAPGIVGTWKELVRISKETKKVKAIGVSNFTVEQLEKVIQATGVVPAMNQIECHPSLIQPELFQYCKDKGIIITAYSPLGNNITGKPRVLDHPEIKTIADRLGKEPAQVLIAWVAKQGFAVIPKSVTPSRIKSNFDDFELSDSDFEAINKIGQANQVRSNIPFVYNPSWPIDIFGTPEEKGQKKAW